MFFIIWRGWGLVVLPILVVSFLVGIGLSEALRPYDPLGYGPNASLGFVAAGLFAASGIYLFAKWRESGEARSFINEATGERVVVRRSAGSLFFIPTRYWTWIVLVLAALGAVSLFGATGPGVAP